MPSKRNRKKELEDLLQFVEFTNLFRSVERLIWFKGVKGRERAGEHAFQLAFVCWFANYCFKLGLDPLRLILIAFAHDLHEAYAGDTPAFLPGRNGAHTPNRQEKERREREARARIKRELGKIFPPIIEAMEAYVEQKDEESRFVYAMDKLLATMNVALDDGRSWKRLGLAIETVDLYKRPRVARHAYVLELYEELFKKLMANRKKFFAALKEAAPR